MKDYRFVIGLLTGTFAGAGLAMWLGQGVRDDVAEAVARGARGVERGARGVERGARGVERGAQGVERGAQGVERGAREVERGAHKVERFARAAKGDRVSDARKRAARARNPAT
jgi:hypothetical protein